MDVSFALLIGLQFAVSWLSARSTTVSQFVKCEPVMRVYHGHVLDQRMRRARAPEPEVLPRRGSGAWPRWRTSAPLP